MVIGDKVSKAFGDPFCLHHDRRYLHFTFTRFDLDFGQGFTFFEGIDKKEPLECGLPVLCM
ncbi:hypothetical protein D1872_276830 [compost metagenome]